MTPMMKCSLTRIVVVAVQKALLGDTMATMMRTMTMRRTKWTMTCLRPRTWKLTRGKVAVAAHFSVPKEESERERGGRKDEREGLDKVMCDNLGVYFLAASCS